jgi:hypothetical protein
MTIVPQGNVSPTRRATNPDSQNLAIPPRTLPRETQITPSIVSTACLDLFSHAVFHTPLTPDAGTLCIILFIGLFIVHFYRSLHFPCQRAPPATTNTTPRPPTISGLRTTQQLDFALRRPRGLSGRIAMA